MQIVMIGAGYVGLVTGACLADFGHLVTCVDKDESRIKRLLDAEMPIFEPGLDDLVARNVREGRLAFTSDLGAALAGADAAFIAVGTPSRRHGDGHADLSYVHACARDIAVSAQGPLVIVTKSTVPVGTGDEIERILEETRPGHSFSVVSNPEFLREGAAIDDFKRPDRIVVGVEDARGKAVMEEIYYPLASVGGPLVVTSRRTAELIKYAANAFLATKITFINEMADLCEATGANVQEVARGIGLDARIGPRFLEAGPGYGGSCFPKDTLALLRTGHENGVPLRVVEAVVNVNDARKTQMARKIAAALGGDIAGKTIAILGLTFKANTDDMRDSPSIPIVWSLVGKGAQVRAYDPEGMQEARKVLEHVAYATNAYDCAADADVVVILTEWDEFRALDLNRLKATMRSPTIVDLRNIYRPEDMARRGFDYHSIGRGVSPARRLAQASPIKLVKG